MSVRYDERRKTKAKEFVYYESIKREIKKRPIYECRCNERLQTKVKEFTRLGYTGFLGGLKHLKIETRLINEKIANALCEYVLLRHNLRWEPWYQGTRAPQPWALVPGHFFILFF